MTTPDKPDTPLRKYIVYSVLFLGMAGCLAALIWLFTWDVTNDARGRQQDCAAIAKAADADYHREKNYNCLVIKDGRIVYDK